MPLNLVLLADTHVPKRARSLPGQVWDAVDRADAVLIHGDAKASKPAWEKVSFKPVADRPIFYIHPPEYLTKDVVKFVLDRLQPK